MATVQRFDLGGFRKATKTKDGFLRADAFLTRTGVFKYEMPDGTIRHELRHPDEVFKTDTMNTLKMAPLTLGHPMVDGRPVNLTPENVKQFTVGSVGENMERRDDLVLSQMMITDATAIHALETKRAFQTSCGYTANTIEETGTYKGQHYDHVQKNIKYNHVAIVARGRQGPEVRVHLDAADAVMVDDEAFRLDMEIIDSQQTFPAGSNQGELTQQPVTRGKPMTKIKIDGMEFEVEENLASLLTQKFDEAVKVATESKTDAEKSTAKMDAVEKELKETKEKLDSAVSPEALQAKIKARVALETIGGKILGEDAKLDEMTDEDIKKAVIVKLVPDIKLDEKEPAYIQARFDAEVDRKTAEEPKNDALDKARKAAIDAKPEDIKAKIEKVRMDRAQFYADAYKIPFAVTLDKA